MNKEKRQSVSILFLILSLPFFCIGNFSFIKSTLGASMRSLPSQYGRFHSGEGIQFEKFTNNSPFGSSYIGPFAIRSQSKESTSNGASNPKSSSAKAVCVPRRRWFSWVSIHTCTYTHMNQSISHNSIHLDTSGTIFGSHLNEFENASNKKTDSQIALANAVTALAFPQNKKNRTNYGQKQTMQEHFRNVFSKIRHENKKDAIRKYSTKLLFFGITTISIRLEQKCILFLILEHFSAIFGQLRKDSYRSNEQRQRISINGWKPLETSIKVWWNLMALQKQDWTKRISNDVAFEISSRLGHTANSFHYRPRPIIFFVCLFFISFLHRTQLRFVQ